MEEWGFVLCMTNATPTYDPVKGETPKIPQAYTQKNNTMETKHREDTPGIGSDNTKSLNPALKPVHQERAKHASLNGAET